MEHTILALNRMDIELGLLSDELHKKRLKKYYLIFCRNGMQYNIHPITQCFLHKAPDGKFVLELNVNCLLLSNDKNYNTQLSFSAWWSESFKPNMKHTILLYAVFKLPQILWNEDYR